MWQIFERQFQNEIYNFLTWFAHTLDSHIVETGKNSQLSESARIFMIAFNLEELLSIYYGTLMIWS